MDRFRNCFLMALAAFSFFSSQLQGQLSSGGVPPSFRESKKLKSVLKSEFIPAPDLQLLKREDKINDSLGRPFRIADMLPADLCMNYSGAWDTLPSGKIIWQAKIYSPGALGLQIICDNFYLPAGDQLFLYSENKEFVIGAFTSQNNHASRQFATEIIPGETCVLEYVQGPNSTEKPSICISQIGYFYRGIGSYSKLKASGTCEVNVKCTPEGDNWTNIKRSVVKIIMGGYQCSGTLLNNTAQDFKNLIATAYHCVTGIEATSPTWVFYFNNERATCSNTSVLVVGNTMTGADILAKTPINGGSDGALLQINGTIPSSYNPYWAGWDIADTVVAGGVCIHHPQGDAKKISTIRSLWKTDTWYGADSSIGATRAHWNVNFAATTNGYGVTEQGSSGSGLFGPDERFRGSLSGGNSSCNVPSGENLFGKLSSHWNKYGTTSSTQYKTWLDPLNTGVKKLNGIDLNTQTGAYWTSSTTTISIDSTVSFKDESSFNPTAWAWTFQGGTPSSSTLQNPVVQYQSPGIYDVSLVVTNDKGTITKARTDYIFVRPKPSWIVQNSRFRAIARGIEGFSIVDSSIVWAWAYDGIDPTHRIKEFTRTIDGGNHWKADSVVIPALNGYGVGNLFALNKDTAYMSLYGPNGGGNIIKTTDAGKTWAIQSSATFAAPNGFPDFVYFFNATNGVCMGDPNNGYFEIYTTSNGGTNWTRVPQSNIPAYTSGEAGTTNMFDAKGDTVWFGTSNGRVYRSINKGLTWTVSSTLLSGQTNVKFRNSKTGIAYVRSDGTNAFAMKKTSDGGVTWQTVANSANLLDGNLTYVPQSPSTWINVTASPAGSSFSINDCASFTSLDADNQYTAVGFYNEFIGWAGGFNIDSTYAGIYKWDKKIDVLTDVPSLKTKVSEFTIQPNPTSDNITISTNLAGIRDVKVSIVNMQGTLLDHYTFKNSLGQFTQTIHMGNYPRGIYLVILQAGETVATRKVILR